MIGLLAFVCLLPQAAPEKLTLDDAVGIALKNAFTIRIAESKFDKARQQEKQAKGAFGPQIGLQGAYQRFDGSFTSSGSGSSGGGTGGGTGGSSGGGSGTSETKFATLSLNQPIDISGLSRKALDATKYSRLAAEAGLGVEANNVKLGVRSSYYNVLLAQALVKVQEDAFKAAAERYDKAVIREREGAIPKFDVLRFSNEVKKTEQALTQAKGTLATAKNALNNALSRPIETDYSVTEIENLPGVPTEPSDVVVEAIKSRPEIKQSEFTITALAKSEAVQGASFAPTLNISATHTRYISPAAGSTDKSTFSGINVNFPLFDSGIARSRVDAAKHDTDVARISLEQLLLGIALEVRNALTQAQTAKKTYDVALDSVALAQESLRLADIRYTEGAGQLLDVTQAQADLTAAQGNAQNAKYQYLTAYANLLKAVGKDDLNQQTK